jgi:Glu-tRNA(Gln) amidotransferase subunit E-like FAD-binding protein
MKYQKEVQQKIILNNKYIKMDYKKLGFKCGIEIHQQLQGKKLFCNCPTIIRKENPDFKIKRILRTSAGELGLTDKAALHELNKKKYFIYEGYNDINCLVEMDDEPPHNVNLDALKSALQISKLLNATIPDKIIFMRKIVIDGSNVSGFQRTALVGMNGYLEINGKKINVPTICLEEESCQVIERNNDFDIYNLSRLGIPLIEIATSPDIENPEECKEVASKIGMFLRSLDNCKRGIGSIRQDVKISIKDCERIEIKGFQDLKSIPKVIDNEINRQLKLLKKNEKTMSHVRKAEADFSTSYLRPMPGANRMYPETDILPIEPNLNIKTIETIEQKIENLKKRYNLNDDFAKLVIKNNNFEFEQLFKDYPNIEPKSIVNIIINFPKDIKKRHNIEIKIKDYYKLILEWLNKNQINFSSIEEIILKLNKKEKIDIDDYKTLSDDEINDVVKKIIDDNPSLPIGALMGRCMQQFKGKVEGKKVNETLKKYLK